MNKTMFVGFLFVALPAMAASNVDQLAGMWNGTVSRNIKNMQAGGNPTLGDTGTPAILSLAKTNAGLSGNSMVGKDKEAVNIWANGYSWNDGSVTVTTKLTTEIPEWVKKEANIGAADTVFAYKFDACTVNQTKKACEVGKDLPDGIQTSGLWVFKVTSDKLHHGVYYTYAKGGNRILEETLSKSK